MLLHFSVFAWLLYLAVCESTGSRPNIVIIVADDLGWNDVGFHGSNQIPTPNIDALAYAGLILNSYYVLPVCTPSRSALMTGRHPIHTGMQHRVIFANEPWGLSLEERLLPEYLQEVGYVTRAVGKWHLGHFTKDYTPTHRGFDSHFGYWSGHQDYYDHTAQESLMYWGHDMRRDMNVSRSESFGRYSTSLFTEEAVSVVRAHDTSRPLFLYLAHLAVHSANPYMPLQAPAEVVDQFQHIESKKRRTFAGMLTMLDQSVGEVVAALAEKKMLENSIILFTSDNGGPAGGFNLNAASNWPLRGVKDTVWEGGIRGAACLWSPLLTSPPRVSQQLMHVQDILPTLMAAINASHLLPNQIKPEDDVDGRLKQLDGKDVWAALNDDTATYDELLLHIDNQRDFSALRQGRWKLIKGTTWNGDYDRIIEPSGRVGIYNLSLVLDSPASKALQMTSRPLPDADTIFWLRDEATVKCNMENTNTTCEPMNGQPCLFDVVTDPCETLDLTIDYPDVLNTLLSRLDSYNSTVVPQRNLPMDPASNPKYWDYTWTNWRDFPTPLLEVPPVSSRRGTTRYS